ncbi:ABC transporter ATP-binding protein [Clostridium sp. 'deep sea']|uniref:ABC transporter ATP-binding protein n=1 Tax=Clostridium sp. 'deep sea' TaxID=2779445 RepID=UPI00189680D5|nr:ABC transporter ATP-binding protein [Clostridium sp. 'deep sea']QOR36297.1 ABC transporter ATP-binding protein [Clostridium sp. 'deep sea']
MLKNLKILIQNSYKDLYKPIILTSLDAIGSMAVYYILFLFIMDLYNQTLTAKSLAIYSVVCFISIIFRVVIYRVGYLSCFTIGFQIAEEVRAEIGEQITKLNLGYFNKNSRGYLLSTLTNDLASFEGVLSHALPFCIKTLVVSVLILLGMLFISLKLAIIQIVVICFALPILKWSGKQVTSCSNNKRLAMNNMVSTVMEYLSGIKVFKSHNLIGKQFSRLLDSMESERKTSIKAEKKLAFPNSMYKIVVSFCTPLVLAAGGFLLYQQSIDAEQFIAVLIMSLALTTLLMAFEGYYLMLQQLKLAVKNLNSVKELKALPFTQSTFSPTNYNISFQNVSFSYEKNKQVLHNVSFKAPQGSKTALIGPSGSGKTTIVNLIARFWDVNRGQIKIGEINIKQVNPNEVLKYISEVFQDNILLNDSIYNNIKIGRANASKNEVIEAAKIAYAHDFIIQLPDGYDTVISELGASLSGGERQRIAIARAILKDAPILLLDESTASLDPDNEQNINSALDLLMKNKTVFVIAHRLSTIKNADNIIVLNDGVIAEMGNHNNLINKQGYYYKMIKQQEQALAWQV